MFLLLTFATSTCYLSRLCATLFPNDPHPAHSIVLPDSERLMNTDQSARLFAQAKTLIPGGVNSPVRACRSVGCDPLFVRRAEGCLITDVDGNEFIDFVGSWGPMILGHAHPEVVEAIQRTAADGTSFGAPCPLEVELADMVCRSVPSLEKVRFVSSGTEATMSAVRLARGRA